MMQEFTQEIKNLMLDTIRDVHSTVPGRIVSFDSDKCEATVQPVAKFRKPDGTTIDYPQIHEVPVYFLQSANQKVTFVYPIKPGDECILLFLEQALDQWRTGAEAKTELRFDLQNCVAIPGLFAKPNPLVKRADANQSIIIQRDESYVEIYGTTGQIDVHSTGDINVKTEKNFNATVAQNIIADAGKSITVAAAQNISITVGGNTITVGENANIKTSGALTIESDTSIALKAPRIDLN